MPISDKRTAKGSSSLLQKLVQVTGFGKNSAGTSEKIDTHKEAEDLSFVYKKEDIERLENEKNDFLSRAEEVLKETEQLKNEHDRLRVDLKSCQEKKSQLELVIEGLKETEKKYYFEEKMAQDVVMFMVKEQRELKQKVDKHNNKLDTSKRELEAVKAEYLFTKGECDYILEKVDFLTDKLSAAVKIRGITREKLSTFLNELSNIRGNMAEIYKTSKVKYYMNE